MGYSTLGYSTPVAIILIVIARLNAVRRGKRSLGA